MACCWSTKSAAGPATWVSNGVRVEVADVGDELLGRLAGRVTGDGHVDLPELGAELDRGADGGDPGQVVDLLGVRRDGGGALLPASTAMVIGLPPLPANSSSIASETTRALWSAGTTELSTGVQTAESAGRARPSMTSRW